MNEHFILTLKRLKMYIRNTARQSKLNGLALINIHRDIQTATEQIINKFSTKGRRLNFRLD